MLCFYESCSKETLANAVQFLQSSGVVCWQPLPVVFALSSLLAQIRIEAGAENSKQAENPTVSLLAPYTEEAQLIKLLERISRLRKPPPVRRDVHKLEGGLRRSLIADIPILAKL
jgi:hypothetical protein